MRKNRPSRRSGRSPFARVGARLFGGGAASTVKKAPRRRELERLEERQMLTANPTSEPYFPDQWYLFADGQYTEFDPTSPTFLQTTAVPGEDINIFPAWNLGYTGEGVQIAVIAGGFDLNHEDLVNAYQTAGLSTDLDQLGGDQDPAYELAADSIGTALAGIVAAEADNEIGIVGIAHGADVFPVRLASGILGELAPTIEAINTAFRFHAGFIQDGDGDGVPDDVLGGALEPIWVDADGNITTEGTGDPDGYRQDPDLVTDVYLHTGGFQQTGSRNALELPTGQSADGNAISILEAIADTAINGRATWIDANDDGLLQSSEIIALGSIHIVPAGNDGGPGFNNQPFIDIGQYASSQYDQLANSIYTIAVGAVDYDGTYENPATGRVSSNSEGGTNVLLVAPSGDFSTNFTPNRDLVSGLVSTDITGDDGANAAPIFNFEFDGDFFANTNYSSQVTGTEAAAAQVAGVVGLMLDANPLLSARDVEQILLMSARQNDQFNASWITNLIQSWDDTVLTEPVWATYSLDTDGDGEADIEDAVLPNSEYDPAYPDPDTGIDPGRADFLVERGFFLNENASIDLGVPFVFAPNTGIDPDTGLPAFFEGVVDLGGNAIPRFADPAGGTDGYSDPTTGLFYAATPFFDPETGALAGYEPVADGSFPEGALPIVSIETRLVNIAGEDEDDMFVEETHIALLYDPNGNLIRNPQQITQLDDELRVELDDNDNPVFGPVGGFTFSNGLVTAPPEVQVVGSNTVVPDPLIIFADGLIPDDATASLFGLLNPIQTQDDVTDLLFENGAGYTVSHGYGNFLEDLSYGYGVLDAGLAVELAEAWETYDLYMDQSITLSSGVLFAGDAFRVQPAINVTDGDGVVLTVPGGLNQTEDINAGYYQEFFSDIGTTDIENAAGDVVGQVITDAPFLNLDDPLTSDRGLTEIPFVFDDDLFEDYLSIEWIEVTTELIGGDMDTLRLAIRSPDGTQSELNAFRPPAGQILAPISPQGQQGSLTPTEDPLNPSEGGVFVPDFIDDTEVGGYGGVETGADSLAEGQAWSWTTNRHRGEIFSTESQSGGLGFEIDVDGFISVGAVDGDQWTLIVENHGFGEITLGPQIEITVHGTKATGNRIQGKIGVDDNKQGISEIDNDENFNFNRYVEFGAFQVEYVDGEGNAFIETVSVVLDDPNDSVTYTNSNTPDQERFSLNNIYKTVDPDTGEELYYPVIDLDAYLSIRTTDDLEAALTTIFDPITSYLQAKGHDDTLTITGAELISSVDRFIDQDIFTVEQALANGFYAERPTDFFADPLKLRNYDYSQESFAAGVAVQAEQFVSTYDIDGNLMGRESTGELQTFVTGADGNYYFDVEATPPAPVQDNFLNPDGSPNVGQYWAAYYAWFAAFGGQTFDYEISILGDDSSRILNNGGEGYFDTPAPGSGGSVEFDGTSTYTVGLFSSGAGGTTTKVQNVNFLLVIDPAETNVDVSGTVFRDRNGDGIQQVGIEESIVGASVLYDGQVVGTTGDDGTYSFTISGLSSTQLVSVQVDTSTATNADGLDFDDPATGIQVIEVVPGMAEPGVDFTLQLEGGEPAQVTGVVFEDLNENGLRDGNETGYANTSSPITVYLDLDGSGTLSEGDISTTTRADGSFLLESATTGSYQVRIVTQEGVFDQTAPAADGGLTVNLLEGQTSELGEAAFGVHDVRDSDFGDLFFEEGVYNYPTLLADNGARHIVAFGTRLGADVDVDTDGFQQETRDPLLDGLGDDYSNRDDEDGVTLLTENIVPGGEVSFQVEAYGGGAVLNAWFDFNNDGDWDDVGEHIFVNYEDLEVGNVNRPTDGIITVTAPQDVDTSAEYYVARFRWGAYGLNYYGSANRGEVEDYLFASTPPIVISGAVRNDIDGDGVFEGTDEAVVGARVFYDRDLDGVLDDNEPRAFTDATGHYELPINSTQSVLDVTLRLDLDTIDPLLQPLVPVDGIFNLSLPQSTSVVANYLVAEPLGVQGTVFNDANQNGSQGGGEGGFAGLLVQVLSDTDNNGEFETIVGSAVTDSAGGYKIELDAIGQYQVRVNLDDRQFLSTTTAGVQTVNVLAGDFATLTPFGVFDAVPTFTLDYGDLFVDESHNFPTTLDDDGARHTIVSGVRLGTVGPDADPGTLHSPNAQADDNLFSPDDEDGVRMASNIAADSEIRIDVTATGNSDNRLHAWIDFNKDGDWDDAGERVTGANGLGLTSGVSTQLVFDTTGITVDETAVNYEARFRWGQGITSYTGLATGGEVEDYLLPRLRTTPLATVGDFTGDGQVDYDDRALWASTLGSVSNLAADANGNGVVDRGDYTVWRDAMDAAPLALAVAYEEPTNVVVLDPLATETPNSSLVGFFGIGPKTYADAPQPVTLPIVEDVLEPVVVQADAALSVGRYFAPSNRSALDESLAVEDDEVAVGDDALDAALLEWSLEGQEAADHDLALEDGASTSDDTDGEPADIETLAESFAV